MDEIHKTLARQVKALAEAREIPLSHLPDRAGVARSHFWDVLAGQEVADVGLIAKVAVALVVEPADLVSPQQAAPRRP